MKEFVEEGNAQLNCNYKQCESKNVAGCSVNELVEEDNAKANCSMAKEERR